MAKPICPACGGSGFVIDPKEIRQRRLEKELTLREVSGKMGISISYLNDLERGLRKWDAELLAKFDKAVA